MAHGHHHIDPAELDRKFEFDGGTKKIISIILGTGLIMLILGIIIAISQEGNLGKSDSHGHGGAHSELIQPKNAQQHINKVIQTELASSSDKTGEIHNSAVIDANVQTVSNKTSGAVQVAEHAHEHSPGAEVHKPVWLSRVLANLTLNSFLFMGISVMFVFFIAVKFASNAGWHIQLLRIAEAFGHLFWIFAIILLLLFLTSKGTLYHWTDAEAVKNDVILQAKTWWLNEPFFLARTIIFTVIWYLFFIKFRNMSREEDRVGGYRLYDNRIAKSAIFLIIFALSFSASAWDWIMSIEAHWFSTMFSVRMFSTCFVSAFALLTLSLIYLKNKGYFKYVNDSHFHDLGKFIMAFSIFWAYIWFSEFMLIWYSNIPEEGIYFYRRFESYPVLFFVNVFLNFVLPFLILLHTRNMRHLPTLGFVSCVVIFGHWLDVYLCVMPGTVGPFGGFGLLEFGMFLTFFGIFLWAGAIFLTKALLVPKNHPYLKESIYHNY